MPRAHRPRRPLVPFRSPLPSRSAVADPLEPRLLLAVNPATLVKDINVTPTANAVSNPLSFIPFKGLTYFRGSQPATGSEWFRTDGTAAGTSLLADINPGIGDSFPPPSRAEAIPAEITTAAVVGDTLFFTAFRPGLGSELWKTDGTEAGTVLVKDILPGPGSGKPLWLIPVGNTLFFSAQDQNLNRQIWKSDGTPEGTQKVTNFAAGTGAVAPYPIAALNGRLMFAGDAPDPTDTGDVLHGLELWSTDGTAAGTALVKNINPSGGSNPGVAGNRDAPVVVSDGRLYFTATEPAHGKELWKTDGTAAGTMLVADVKPGPVSSSPIGLTAVNGTVYFVALQSPAGSGNPVVYRTGPAPAAVSPVGEIPLTWNTVSAGNVGGAFYALGMHNTRAALYRSDPANPAAGLTLVTDLANSTGVPIDPGPIVDVGGTAVFVTQGPAGETFAQLWRSDGTANGTGLLAAFPGAGPVARGAGGLAYLAAQAPAGTWPFRTDGTPAGSRWVNAFAPLTVNSYPGPFADVGGRAVFFATEAAHGREPWVSDGTGAGTVLLKDIRPGASGSSRTGGVMSPVLNGLTYFDATSSDVEYSEQLWATDGTPAGTYRVKDFGPVSGPGITQFVPFGGRMFFVVPGFVPGPGPSPAGVWVTDGTEAGTQQVGPEQGDVGPLVPFKGALYYVVLAQGRGAELWKTDGTAAGTVPLRLLSGSATPARAAAAVVDGVLYFLAPSPVGAALWRSDGTAGGTSVVAAVPEGVTHVVAAEHRLLLTSGGEGLQQPTLVWVSDGTAAGTHPLSELVPELVGFTGDPLTFDKPQPTAAGGTVYFFGRSAAGVPQVWQTDGTAAGTHLVKAFSGARGVESLGVVDGLAYFYVRDDSPLKQMWRTAGTEASTQRVLDMSPLGPAATANPAAVGDRIYFPGRDYQHGVELWSIPRTPAAASVFYNNSAFDFFTPGAVQADLGAIAPDKVPLLAGQTPSFANVTSYEKGINGVFIDLLGDRPGLFTEDFRVEVSADGAAWTEGPSASVNLTPAPTPSPFSHYDLIWADRLIVNTWMRVTVLANSRTGLSVPMTFAFGNLVGETGDGDGSGGWRVSAIDLAATNVSRSYTPSLTSVADFNRDGRVNAIDLAWVRRNLNRTLGVPPPPPAAVSLASPAAPRRPADEMGLADDGAVL